LNGAQKIFLDKEIAALKHGAPRKTKQQLKEAYKTDFNSPAFSNNNTYSSKFLGRFDQVWEAYYQHVTHGSSVGAGHVLGTEQDHQPMDLAPQHLPPSANQMSKADLQEHINAQQVPDEDGMDMLKRRVNESGFELNKVVGDGHCQFRTMAHQISERFPEDYPGGEGYSWRQVRAETAEWLRNNEHNFGDFLQSEPGAENPNPEGGWHTTWEEFCQDMEFSNPNATVCIRHWGDHVTLEAMANIYKRPIYVWTTRIGDAWWTPIEPQPENLRFPDRPFMVALFGEFHYDSVCEREGREEDLSSFSSRSPAVARKLVPTLVMVGEEFEIKPTAKNGRVNPLLTTIHSSGAPQLPKFKNGAWYRVMILQEIGSFASKYRLRVLLPLGEAMYEYEFDLDANMLNQKKRWCKGNNIRLGENPTQQMRMWGASLGISGVPSAVSLATGDLVWWQCSPRDWVAGTFLCKYDGAVNFETFGETSDRVRIRLLDPSDCNLSENLLCYGAYPDMAKWMETKHDRQPDDSANSRAEEAWKALSEEAAAEQIKRYTSQSVSDERPAENINLFPLNDKHKLCQKHGVKAGSMEGGDRQEDDADDDDEGFVLPDDLSDMEKGMELVCQYETKYRALRDTHPGAPKGPDDNDDTLTKIHEWKEELGKLSGENTVSVAMFGPNGIGKSYAINQTLVATAPAERNYGFRLDRDVPVEIGEVLGALGGRLEAFEAVKRVISEDSALSDAKNKELNERIDALRKCIAVPVCANLKANHVSEEDLKAEKDRFRSMKRALYQYPSTAPDTWYLHLLPCKQGSTTTTPVAIQVQYGKIFHYVRVLEDQQKVLKEMLSYDWEDKLQLYEDDELDDEGKDILVCMCRKLLLITGRPSNEVEEIVGHDPSAYDLRDATEHQREQIGRKTLELCDEVKQMLRQPIEIVSGLGWHMTEDRIFVRGRLQELLANELVVCLLKTLIVFDPSELLGRGLELLDVPGADADPVKRTRAVEALRKADCVVVQLLRHLKAHRDVLGLLEQSETFDRAYRYPEERTLAFLSTCSEVNHNLTFQHFNQRIKNSDDEFTKHLFNVKENLIDSTLKSHIKNCYVEDLEKRQGMSNKEANEKAKKDIDNIIAQCFPFGEHEEHSRVVSYLPLLSTSLLLYPPEVSELCEERHVDVEERNARQSAFYHSNIQGFFQLLLSMLRRHKDKVGDRMRSIALQQSDFENLLDLDVSSDDELVVERDQMRTLPPAVKEQLQSSIDVIVSTATKEKTEKETIFKDFDQRFIKDLSNRAESEDMGVQKAIGAMRTALTPSERLIEQVKKDLNKRMAKEGSTRKGYNALMTVFESNAKGQETKSMDLYKIVFRHFEQPGSLELEAQLKHLCKDSTDAFKDFLVDTFMRLGCGTDSYGTRGAGASAQNLDQEKQQIKALLERHVQEFIKEGGTPRIRWLSEIFAQITSKKNWKNIFAEAKKKGRKDMCKEICSRISRDESQQNADCLIKIAVSLVEETMNSVGELFQQGVQEWVKHAVKEFHKNCVQKKPRFRNPHLTYLLRHSLKVLFSGGSSDETNIIGQNLAGPWKESALKLSSQFRNAVHAAFPTRRGGDSVKDMAATMIAGIRKRALVSELQEQKKLADLSPEELRRLGVNQGRDMKHALIKFSQMEPFLKDKADFIELVDDVRSSTFVDGQPELPKLLPTIALTRGEELTVDVSQSLFLAFTQLTAGDRSLQISIDILQLVRRLVIGATLAANPTKDMETDFYNDHKEELSDWSTTMLKDTVDGDFACIETFAHICRRPVIVVTKMGIGKFPLFLRHQGNSLYTTEDAFVISMERRRGRTVWMPLWRKKKNVSVSPANPEVVLFQVDSQDAQERKRHFHAIMDQPEAKRAVEERNKRRKAAAASTPPHASGMTSAGGPDLTEAEINKKVQQASVNLPRGWTARYSRNKKRVWFCGLTPKKVEKTQWEKPKRPPSDD